MPPASPLEQQKKVALSLILDAWERARAHGCSAEAVASTAIYAALTDMVELHGPEPVAQMAETLPGRIRAGEFTLAG